MRDNPSLSLVNPLGPHNWALIKFLHLFILEPHGQIKLWIHALINVFRDSCRDIKSLKSLRRFTLSIPQNLDKSDTEELVNILKPLKGVSMKAKWELRIEGSPERYAAVNAALNASGFRCSVTSYMRSKQEAI